TAGIMTTRAASESNLGEEVSDQLLANPKPVAIASVILLLMALIPGLPFFAFFLLSAVTGAIAFLVYKDQHATAELIDHGREEEMQQLTSAEDDMEKLMRVDPLGLELGYQLIHLVENKPGGDFLSRVKSIRRQLALELGVIVPPVHITDNLQLKSREYRILLKGVGIAEGELMPGYLLAIDPGNTARKVEGIPTTEP